MDEPQPVDTRSTRPSSSAETASRVAPNPKPRDGPTLANRRGGGHHEPLRRGF